MTEVVAILLVLAGAVLGGGLAGLLGRARSNSTEVVPPQPQQRIELVLEDRAAEDAAVREAAAASDDPFGAVAALGRQDRWRRAYRSPVTEAKEPP